MNSELIIDRLKWKINDLKKRKSQVLSESSRYAMNMSILELEEIFDFVVSLTGVQDGK